MYEKCEINLYHHPFRRHLFALHISNLSQGNVLWCQKGKRNGAKIKLELLR